MVRIELQVNDSRISKTIWNTTRWTWMDDLNVKRHYGHKITGKEEAKIYVISHDSINLIFQW